MLLGSLVPRVPKPVKVCGKSVEPVHGWNSVLCTLPPSDGIWLHCYAVGLGWGCKPDQPLSE